MNESWKKWPGSTIWVHGKPHADPADDRNDKYYRDKKPKAEKKKSLLSARGGGGGGNIGMMSQSGVQSLIKPKADFKR